MRKINEIIIHCSATPEGKEFTVKDIDNWHRQRGFTCIGYHYVIYLDGSVHEGREIEKVGAHCLNHNSHSIGICYIGGLDKEGKNARDTRTAEQRESLFRLVYELMRKYGISIQNVKGHYELTVPYKAKCCPSFEMNKFRKELNEFIK